MYRVLFFNYYMSLYSRTYHIHMSILISFIQIHNFKCGVFIEIRIHITRNVIEFFKQFTIIRISIYPTHILLIVKNTILFNIIISIALL